MLLSTMIYAKKSIPDFCCKLIGDLGMKINKSRCNPKVLLLYYDKTVGSILFEPSDSRRAWSYGKTIINR